MATHSSVLAWQMLWTEEPGTLQFFGSQMEFIIYSISPFHLDCKPHKVKYQNFFFNPMYQKLKSQKIFVERVNNMYS